MIFKGFSFDRPTLKSLTSKTVAQLLLSCFHLDLLQVFAGYNPVQGIWSRVGKFSEMWQGKESLISTFACFLTAIARV